MTERTLAWLKAQFQQRDPQDWVDDLLDSVPALTGTPQLLLATIAYGDGASTSLGTVPANSVITTVYVARTTAWDALTAFTIGKSGDTDWLVTTAEANLDGAIPSGESQDVEVIADSKAVDAATEILITYTAGAASAGAGYVVLEYIEEVAGG